MLLLRDIMLVRFHLQPVVVDTAAAVAKPDSMEVTDADTFGRTMDRLLSDGKFLAERGRIAGQYIERNAGASDLIFDSVKF